MKNPVCEVVRAATGHDKALLSFSCVDWHVQCLGIC